MTLRPFSRAVARILRESAGAVYIYMFRVALPWRHSCTKYTGTEFWSSSMPIERIAEYADAEHTDVESTHVVDHALQ